MELVKEEPKKRTLNDINVDYRNVCGKHGDLDYKIEQLEKEIDGLKQKKRELDIEAAEIAKETKTAEPASVEAMPEPASPSA